MEEDGIGGHACEVVGPGEIPQVVDPMEGGNLLKIA
jgi:hypothetical protein